MVSLTEILHTAAFCFYTGDLFSACRINDPENIKKGVKTK